MLVDIWKDKSRQEDPNNIVFSERIDPLKIQDIGLGFVPYNLDEDIPDNIICISEDEVVEMVKQLPF